MNNVFNFTSKQIDARFCTKSLYDIACTKKKTDPDFCADYKETPVCDFDAVKDAVSKIRGEQLCSADIFIETPNREYIFIEFKQRKYDSLNHAHDRTNLKKKLFDSLSVAGMSLLDTLPFSQICRHVHYLLVYDNDLDLAPRRDIFGDTTYEDCFLQCMKQEAKLPKDVWGIEIRWDFDRFQNKGYYQTVHTWTESDFRRFGPALMNGQFPSAAESAK